MSPSDHTSLPNLDDEEAGGREPFEDAALYDFEYRRRRADVNFYRQLVKERFTFAGAGPVLDLACGSGRLIVPLLKDGHTVVGLDRSQPMLARAAWRISRLSATRRRRVQLVQGDLRTIAFKPRFAMAICAFHSVQHLVSSNDVLSFLRRTRRSLLPNGWLAFDTIPPDPRWIARDSTKRWARTVFRHPTTGQRLVYTTNHVYDRARRVLNIRLYYQPVDARGRPSGPERVARLCQRQFPFDEMHSLLTRAGFTLFGTFGGFDGRPLSLEEGQTSGRRADSGENEQHIFVARPRAQRRDLVGK